MQKRLLVVTISMGSPMEYLRREIPHLHECLHTNVFVQMSCQVLRFCSLPTRSSSCTPVHPVFGPSGGSPAAPPECARRGALRARRTAKHPPRRVARTWVSKASEPNEANGARLEERKPWSPADVPLRHLKPILGNWIKTRVLFYPPLKLRWPLPGVLSFFVVWRIKWCSLF